jgi:hypothetical protein
MGFSPGEFANGHDELHWEGKGSGDIVLWGPGEMKVILWLELKEARKCLDQLSLLVTMAEEGRL